MNSILESDRQHPNELRSADDYPQDDGFKYIEVGDGHKIGPYNVRETTTIILCLLHIT